MDAPTYTYDSQLWRPSPTVSDKDSFFHSAFGVRSDESEPYFDKHAKFKRMRWSAFLTYMENESMPSCLIDTLKKCFSSHEKYKDVSVEDKNQFACYVYDITFSDQSVNVEEIPILATLENIKIVLLSDSVLHPVTVITPNIELLGSYSNSSERPKEVLLSLQGNVFSRLEPVEKGSVTKSDYYIKTVENKSFEENVQGLGKSSVKYERYKKGGTSGSKGVKFQLSLLTMFLINAIIRRLSDWRLSSENTKAGKFDDVVLECSEGDVLLQAKYRESKAKKITLDDLMSVNSKNDDFSLPKYFLSYQEIKDNFKIRNLIICTNASLHHEVSKFINTHNVCPQSMLHHENERCSFHKFEREILHRLKENVTIYLEKNPKKKDVNGIIITAKDLQDFLNCLQFYSDFPTGNDLQKVMKQLLSDMNLYRQSTYLEVYAKIMNWFQQNDGVYLNETFTKAIFLEIWRDKYWQKLEQYKVHFQHNDLNFQQSNRIIHIAADDGYFLQELKLYRALKDKEKTLYFHWDDGSDVQKQVTESFRLPNYVLLIIIGFKFENVKESARSTCEELKEILQKYEYKNVIIVTKPANKIIPQIHDDYTVAKSSVSFEDFSQDTQERLLTKRNIVFQGRCISLEELFTNRTIKDYDKVIDSELLEKIIKEEKIRVGLPLVGLNENIIRFYIRRQFKREIGESDRKECEFSVSGETFPEENIFKINEKLILISDVAGMGKSTTLTNLATTIKEKHPHFWVIRIELNDYTMFLQALRTIKENTINIMDLLNSRETTKFTNQLERFVFTLLEKVVLMLDGIDEISPDYTDLILNMLIECQEVTNFAKIIVTTRPHMVNDMELKLKLKTVILQPFSEKDQVDFFTNYWVHSLELDDKDKERCEQYAKVLVSRMSKWMKVYPDDEDKDRRERCAPVLMSLRYKQMRMKFYQERSNFPGVPLQAKMLAEIFQESNKWTEPIEWEGCREYLIVDNAEPKLPEEFNITRMYEMFIEKKREVFLNKGNPSGNTAANQALDDKFNESLSSHRQFALEMIIGIGNCSFFSSYRSNGKDSENMLVKIGIVQKVNQEFHFIHRTFAEYFVAESLLNELDNENSNFQKFLIDEVLLNVRYSLIRTFFDTFLHKVVDSLPSSVFERYQYLVTKAASILDERYKSNLIFQVVEQGLVATLRFICKCINFKTGKEVLVTDIHKPKFSDFDNMINMIKTGMGETALHLASQRGHLEMVKYLISQGANIECRDSDGHTPLHSAILHRRLDITKFLVDQGANINSRNNKGRTIPHDSIIRHQVNNVSFLLLKILEQGILDVKNSMISYMAAFLGRSDILQMLIERDLNLNSVLNGEETLITVAALGNQLDTIKYLIDQGADINLKNSYGNTVLHKAARKGQLDMVTFLILKCGIDVNVSNRVGFTSLNMAVLSGHLDTVKFLVDHGANVHVRDEKYATILHLASLMRKCDIVRFLVLKLGFPVDVTNENGHTPLHLAVEGEHLNIIKLLVEHGANVHIRDNNGETMLHFASWSESLDIVRFFVLEVGFCIDVTNKKGCTSLHIASSKFHWSIVKFLVEQGANINVRDNSSRTALHSIVCEGSLEIIRVFIVEFKADVNVRNENGQTVLHLAVKRGELDILEFLILFDANINIMDNAGLMAVHLAASWGKLDIVKLFIDYGLDVNVRDRNGRTLLHRAAPWNDLETIKFLVVECGVDIDAIDNAKRTALHLASRIGRLDSVRLLVENGASVHFKDERGCMALHLAASNGHLGIVKFLAERGADIHIAEHFGRTALHLAVLNGHLSVVDFLVGQRVNMYARDKEGCSALKLADLKGNRDVTKYLVECGADIDALD